jgi:hypothetical protein
VGAEGALGLIFEDYDGYDDANYVKISWAALCSAIYSELLKPFLDKTVEYSDR